MVSRLTYWTILVGLSLFLFCVIVPGLRGAAIHALIVLPLVVGVMNGIELIVAKRAVSGVLLLASVAVLIGSVLLRSRN